MDPPLDTVGPGGIYGGPDSAGPEPELSCISFKSDGSNNRRINFKTQVPAAKRIYGGPDSAGPEPEPSCVSFKSDGSNNRRINFKTQVPAAKRICVRPDSAGPEPEPSCISFKTPMTSQQVSEPSCRLPAGIETEYGCQSPGIQKVLKEPGKNPTQLSGAFFKHSASEPFQSCSIVGVNFA
ncbi:hypothetical protein Q8A73_004071 [Channa argus]|nr:hypothetical protein Q8A73_004071 [Channa argus]